MATLTVPCIKCANKGVGIFKCQGCSNVFCRKHASEHRIQLSQQLDEIAHEHDQLYQLITGENNEYHSLINQVNQWEQNSIGKVQQLAENIRQEIEQYIKFQKGNHCSDVWIRINSSCFVERNLERNIETSLSTSS